MDPRRNPYTPGSGLPPPELSGRSAIIESAGVAIDRIRAGRSARSSILHGLRGVGKTVLLNQVRLEAEARGIAIVKIKASQERSLPAVLVGALRAAILRLSRGGVSGDHMRAAMGTLAGFAKARKLTYPDIGFPLHVAPERGLAATGDLDTDLTEVLLSLGKAARAGETALVLFIDELHHVALAELASLITALDAARDDQVPVMLMAAGLPQLAVQTGRARSYAERLFEFVSLDRLNESDAASALTVPAARQNVVFDPDAIAEILCQTCGYPRFLQEWGKHAWNVAAASPIRIEDISWATDDALADLDEGFFRVRFDRLTAAEKNYLRAVAELGHGPHRSGDIAAILQRAVTTLAPIRRSLMAKGLIYSRAYGETEFTAPLFDGFMKRIMPEFSQATVT